MYTIFNQTILTYTIRIAILHIMRTEAGQVETNYEEDEDKTEQLVLVLGGPKGRAYLVQCTH